MRRLDWHRVINADPQGTASATYVLIDAAQGHTVEERLLAAACHLKLATEAAGVSPQDVMTAADNIMASPEGQHRRAEFLAAREYMENEG